MTIPVLKYLLQQQPGLRISFVSQPFFKPLFANMERLSYYEADIKKEFRGVTGLYKLSRKIKKDISYDAIADLHDSLRTKFLRSVLPGPAAVIDKGRKEKKELTRPKNKIYRPLKTTFQRYADVFEKLGLPVALQVNTGWSHLVANLTLLPVRREGKKLIGVAPFAKHSAKMYPLQKMKQVVQMLSQRPDTIILLFGNKEEGSVLEPWGKELSNVHTIAGHFSFADELNLLSQLDLMISMDSANMHLASLYAVPVVSVWGGTHPYAGFYGWGQLPENAVQLDLPCRPSSVFGNKECPVHGKQGCMVGITPDMILERVKEMLERNPKNRRNKNQIN
jgi:ADP-heptose:LPS heptosyltransferase